MSRLSVVMVIVGTWSAVDVYCPVVVRVACGSAINGDAVAPSKTGVVRSDDNTSIVITASVEGASVSSLTPDRTRGSEEMSKEGTGVVLTTRAAMTDTVSSDDVGLITGEDVRDIASSVVDGNNPRSEVSDVWGDWSRVASADTPTTSDWLLKRLVP